MNLKILEYHAFNEKPSEYIYSRTYDQFIKDIESPFDWITMDDGRLGQKEACEILQRKNIRAKLGINIELLGTPGHMTWEDVEEISKYHDIENHGAVHIFHTHMSNPDIAESILKANEEIQKHTGRMPRYFIPPYNQTNQFIDDIAHSLGLKVIVGREVITNSSLL